MNSGRLVERFGDLNKKQSSHRIVSAFVWVFEIGIKPIMRVMPIVTGPPELRAMNSVTYKSRVNVNDMNIRMLLNTARYYFIVSIKYCLDIFPCRQTSSSGIAGPICGIKNICKINLASAGKSGFNLLNQRFNALPKIVYPRSGFIESCPIHCLFARRRPSVIMNQVVAPCCNHDNSQSVSIRLMQMGQFLFQKLNRGAAGDC